MNRAFIISVLLGGFLCGCHQAETYRHWSVTGGGKDNIRYTTLTQIDTSNVAKLEVAWIYHTGDADTLNHSQIQCNPIVVNGVMYITSPQLKLIALDADTGGEKWRFDPQAEQQIPDARARFSMNNNRGVTWWSDNKDSRILYTAGSNLYALDAITGKLIQEFGDHGIVDLHEGLGRDVHDLYVASTSPGIIYQDLFIIGSRVSEGSDAAPGHIRAYNVHTGKQQWIFHTIPQPGEFGFESWEDTTAYRHVGGANSWSGFSLDEKRGILFAPTGSASYDFYGGMRKGDNLFANCILALDAATGKYRWHYQTIHHDVWDRDLPTAPSLVTVSVNGKQVEAVAQATKHGFIFLLDRETGRPLYPIEEQPVPQHTELHGEKLSLTQPIPTFPEPFMRQTFAEADLNDLLPDTSFQEIRERYQGYDKGHLFTPPSMRGTIFFPGLDGGAEWGGTAFDPEGSYLFVNANEIPWVMTMIQTPAGAVPGESYLEAGERIYRMKCMACHGPERKGAANYPTLAGSDRKYNAGSFAELMKSGRRMMPAFTDLKPEEINALADYVLEGTRFAGKKFPRLADVKNAYRDLPYSNTGYPKFQSKEGLPANRPPWGTLNAINLNTGEIAWKVTLGHHPALKHVATPTGTENYGGPVVTKSGLVIIAATMDQKIRAFSKKTGALLWEADLPAPGFATPAVYEARGREYVVIACGGGKLGTRSGDAYVAFALPGNN